MEYTPRPGIVCLSLCGMKVLTPSRVASRDCKSILPLNFFGAIVWNAIEKDEPVEKVLELSRIFSKKTDPELLDRIQDYCEMLREQGFVLPKAPADPAPAEASGTVARRAGEASR